MELVRSAIGYCDWQYEAWSPISIEGDVVAYREREEYDGGGAQAHVAENAFFVIRRGNLILRVMYGAPGALDTGLAEDLARRADRKLADAEQSILSRGLAEVVEAEDQELCAQPTCTPVPRRTPAWQEADLMNPAQGREDLLLDVQTGKGWQLSEDPPGTSEPGQGPWPLAWSPSGEALVAINSGGRSEWPRGELFLGRPGEPFRQFTTMKQPVATAQWSGDGTLLALGVGEGVTIVDGSTGQIVADLRKERGSFAGLSSDGAFIAFSVPTDKLTGAGRVLSRDGQIVAEIPRDKMAWSHSGHKLAYFAGEFRDNPETPYEVRVRDIDSGEDRAIGTVFTMAVNWDPVWSPDDRFVVADYTRLDDRQAYVAEVATGKGVVVHAGSPGGWLGDHSLVVDGRLGDSDVFLLDPTNAGLRELAGARGGVGGEATPQGWVAWFEERDGARYLRLLEPVIGTVRDVGPVADNVALQLGAVPTTWSPDGRFRSVRSFPKAPPPPAWPSVSHPDTWVEVLP